MHGFMKKALVRGSTSGKPGSRTCSGRNMDNSDVRRRGTAGFAEVDVHRVICGQVRLRASSTK